MKNNISEILKILESHYSDEVRTTLNRMRENPDPFKILIGCLVSINIKDDVTDKILEELFERVGNFEDIIDMDLSELEDMLYLARYRKVKAARLKSVSKEIIEKFDGEVPDDKDKLLSINGIGPKTCNVVLCFAFGKNAIPVDSNTIRIANRLGWIDSDKHNEVEELLVDSLEGESLRGANALFMLHGKSTCVPVSPFCSGCPVSLECLRVGVEKSR
ncbi:hypothetical protein CMI42_03170 [Candidatus Pacearchaeota archaeon]|nr:hypothetical protein [Candidatus Pacearchaeota archaeon]|tara:strand:- start:645 stop:1295 length:651 start_codon:yes stop_codon:yes gene_type:complete